MSKQLPTNRKTINTRSAKTSNTALRTTVAPVTSITDDHTSTTTSSATVGDPATNTTSSQLSTDGLEFISTASQVATGYLDMIQSCKATVSKINDTGDADQNNMALVTIEKITNGHTSMTMADTVKICALNDKKRLELQQIKISTQSAAQRQDDLPPKSAQYKITFKRIDFDGDSPIADPIMEFYSATNFKIQLADMYTSTAGDVIFLYNKADYDSAMEALKIHLVNEGAPFTNLYDISFQVISPYSFKTDPVSVKLLEDNNCITFDNDNRKMVDTAAFIKTLRLYNPGHFPLETDIEYVQVFGKITGDNPVLSFKIHVCHKQFQAFMRTPKPKIFLAKQRIHIYEDVPVLQCQRCCRFGHSSSAKGCKYTPRCRYCGADEKGPGGHRSKVCPKIKDPVCPNCTEYNEENEILPSEPPAHHAFNFKCPLLREQSSYVREKAKREAIARFTH